MPSPLPPRRIVAMLLIALTAGGLALSRTMRDPEGVALAAERARDAAGVLVALPVMASLVLAVIAGRVHRRSRLRAVESALVRSLLAAALGLAGWALAVGIVLVTSSDVAVDDRSLVLVAVSLPVAAGTYVGWLDLARTKRERSLGLAAAVAGAVIGAWLAFTCAAGPPAILSAVAGAVAGANLALIAQDVIEPAPTHVPA